MLNCLIQRYPKGLEENFSVAWWNQRRAGISYSPDIPSVSMTLKQFIYVTLAVTLFLLASVELTKFMASGIAVSLMGLNMVRVGVLASIVELVIFPSRALPGVMTVILFKHVKE